MLRAISGLPDAMRARILQHYLAQGYPPTAQVQQAVMPVGPGMMRLFRGAAGSSGGPWFTPDQQYAELYSTLRRGLPGAARGLSYVDVPAKIAAEAQAAGAAARPVGMVPLRAGLRRPEMLLPHEWAQKALPWQP